MQQLVSESELVISRKFEPYLTRIRELIYTHRTFICSEDSLATWLAIIEDLNLKAAVELEANPWGY